MPKKPDHFSERAREWDKGNVRVQNAHNIANTIQKRFQLSGDEHVMDFGAGTGLLSESIAPNVAKITAIDYSAPMLEEFEKKSWPCETAALNIDLTEANLDYEFDGIISSMTLHHIRDIDELMNKFFKMLKPGAFVALADLAKEDGTFHGNNTGVEHFGFEPAYMEKSLKNAGFKSVKVEEANVITKETIDGIKDFPILLFSAIK